MANISSAKKRILVSKKKQLRNKSHISKLKTILKKYDAAISAQDVGLAKELLPQTVGLIDNLRHKGILHDNNADRKKSAAYNKLNALIAALNQPQEQTEQAEQKAD